MTRAYRWGCPPWCIADHPIEDDGTTRHHRGATVTVPGVAIGRQAPHSVESIDLLIELHADDGDPVVGIYLGDGLDSGLDITTETAGRMVRRLVEVLRSAGGPAM